MKITYPSITADALRKAPRSKAFSRLELLVTAGSVFFLLALALPALASKARSQQIVCFNNLRQIGRAFHLWGNDHNNLLPAHVSPAEGGTALTNSSYSHPIWGQFGVLSNELGTPKILACPSDDRRVATEFSFNPSTLEETPFIATLTLAWPVTGISNGTGMALAAPLSVLQ